MQSLTATYFLFVVDLHGNLYKNHYSMCVSVISQALAVFCSKDHSKCSTTTVGTDLEVDSARTKPIAVSLKIILRVCL